MIVESYEDVIALSGDLKSNFWETIHTAISLTLVRHPEGVIIDCSEITECTEEGANTFLDALDFIEEQDARVILVDVPQNIYNVLKSLPETRSQLPISPTIEDARQSLRFQVDPELDSETLSKFEVMPTILACVNGTDTDKGVINIVVELAEATDAAICWLFPIIIPREQPLQAPMKDLEEEAGNVLENIHAQIKDHDVVDKFVIERARDVPSAILQAIEEYNVKKLVIGLDKHILSENTCSFIQSVIKRVDAQVLFVKSES